MNRDRILILLGCGVILLSAWPAQGSLDLECLSRTPPVASPFPSPEEPGLLGEGGILDQLYGLENLTRIGDTGPESDQLWTISAPDGRIRAAVRAKYAGFRHSFGILTDSAGDEFLPLVYTGQGNYNHLPPGQNGNGSANAKSNGKSDWAHPEDPTPVRPVDPGQTFRWGLQIEDKPGYFWSSANDDNHAGVPAVVEGALNQMITFRISGSEGRSGNNIGNYILAWEDLPAVNTPRCEFDNDFNDLVLEVAGVDIQSIASVAIPEPASVATILFGAACMFVLPRPTRRSV